MPSGPFRLGAKHRDLYMCGDQSHMWLETGDPHYRRCVNVFHSRWEREKSTLKVIVVLKVCCCATCTSVFSILWNTRTIPSPGHSVLQILFIGIFYWSYLPFLAFWIFLDCYFCMVFSSFVPFTFHWLFHWPYPKKQTSESDRCENTISWSWCEIKPRCTRSKQSERNKGCKTQHL